MGLFGGNKKEGETIEPSEYFEQAKGYYGTYSKWTKEAKDRYKSDSAKNRAASASSGGNGDMLEAVQNKRANEQATSLKDLENGEHGRFLTAYFNETKRGILGALNATSEKTSSITPNTIRQDRGKFGGAQFFDSILDAGTREIIKNRNSLALDTSNESIDEGARASNPIFQGALDHTKRKQGKLRVLNQSLQSKVKEVEGLTFDEFFGGQFGSGEQPLSNEQQAKNRAKNAASGRRSAAAQQSQRVNNKLNTVDKLEGQNWWA